MESKTFLLICPLDINYSTNKKFSLNMNTYRNAHFFVLNNAKKALKELLHDQIAQLPKAKRAKVDYEVYSPDKRRRDGMNIISVCSKFFLDAIVEYGVLPDDSMEYLYHEEWNYGGQDPHNGRVEIYLTLEF